MVTAVYTETSLSVGWPLTEEEMETASEKIIINFLNTDDVKCVADLNSDSRTSAIVRNAVDATLKGISIPQECTGLLHYNLHMAGMQHTLRDLQETLKGLRVDSGRRICIMAAPGRDGHPHDWGRHPHGRAVWLHEGHCNMWDHWCLGGKLYTCGHMSLDSWPKSSTSKQKASCSLPLTLSSISSFARPIHLQKLMFKKKKKR